MELNALALKFADSRLFVLDQRVLPDREEWIEIRHPDDMVRAIRELKIRGAPLIGIGAALALYRFALEGTGPEEIIQAARRLRDARPTAVNLMVAVDRMVLSRDPGQLTADFLGRMAGEIFYEDLELCDRIASAGASLFEDGDRILTHCNTGGLATAGVGTAFGVIRRLFESGRRIHVYVDETRPLLQGGRLTAWECEKFGIPYTLICDNMAPSLMRAGQITKVIVGADRIALNGDFANKTGTYGAALAAEYHGLPFYVAAPWTTIDPLARSAVDIPVEERDPNEVRGFAAPERPLRWAPATAPVFNPAFDVTPTELVSAFILNSGTIDRAGVEAGALRKAVENSRAHRVPG